MDCSEVEDSLDSLWFFSNVLSARTRQSSKPVNEDAVQEEQSKPRNQTEDKTQINESPCAGSLVPRCPRCGEFAPELRAKQVQVLAEEFTEPAEEKSKSSSSIRRRRRRRRRKKSLFHERRKILGELDLGFDYGNLDSEWVFNEEQTRNEKQIFGSQQPHMNMKMPPLTDNMAMKEHLKSWAYAVACTVK
ncbi:WD repeat-containing protein 53 [Melia azedarach]|uniref:WD repeat-containing protein 53 n=1 Tax=Melia azedarach TaxID=155640 RepID=A0ACC1WXP4_MELAZ|nr:WD repeat-containing protein 53 [Melia azedarach]